MSLFQLTGSSDAGASAAGSAIPAIPFEMAVLPNGLTLIVHEDRRHPLVSTQLRFNVGSKDEPAGRTGFAHLFEHLMFKEIADRRGNWHRMLHAMGGIGVNGTTNLDRTNYYQTVPTAALDRLLWMEADRMGNLLAGLDAGALADEISVVKNEKRQREGAPYGGVFEAITTTLYPREHPYGHTVLGSFEDLDRVDLNAAADWHARWYGAANAVLVLAGDIGFEDARRRVEQWFGAISPGVPACRTTQWLPEVRDTKRIELFDRVPMRRLYSVWSTPPATSLDSTQLQIVAAILAGGAHSRLIRRLVDGDRLCVGIGCSQDGRALCGEFQIAATLVPGADPAAVERAIDEEIARFVADGPTQDELDRARKTGRDGLLRMLDGPASVAEMLASNMLLHGRPDGYLAHVEASESASVEEIRAVAARWLCRKAVQLDVRPFEAVPAPVDPAQRPGAPAIGPVHAPRFPEVQQVTLGNGLTIQLARRRGTHAVDCALYLDGGSGLDPAGREGLSRIALSALTAGAGGCSKVELSRLLAEYGVNYRAEVLPQGAILMMSALRTDVDRVLPLVARILLDPTYPADELRHFLDRQIVEARGNGRSAAAAAEMALAPLAFGPDHAFARPVAGTAETLSRIDRDLVMARHRAWLKPGSATLVVVGDVSLADVAELAGASFGSWTESRASNEAGPSVWDPRPGRYRIDRPGSAQSAIRVAMTSPRIRAGDEALTLVNSLFGGSFGSRLNANLRERRGWTYGAGSGLTIAPGIGAFIIATDVQADRTREALDEIERELAALGSDRPPSNAEIEEARDALLMALPARWSTNGAVRDALLERRMLGLPADHQDAIERRLRAVTRADVLEAARLIGVPESYSRVVAGDPSQLPEHDVIAIDQHGHRA